MRVLVTGGTGMLGATLVPALKGAGHCVFTQGRASGGAYSADLTDFHVTVSMLKEIRPECIVNLVAQTNVDACEADLHSAYLLNVRTVENLAAAIRLYGKVHLIHISTDQVYDGVGMSTEDQVRLPNNYAMTKYAGEMAAALVNGTVLRTNFFGPSALASRLSFSDWLLKNFREHIPFTAFSDVIVNPLSMATLSLMINKVIQAPVEGVFNLGSQNPLSKAGFAFQVANTFGLEPTHMRTDSVDTLALRARRPKDMSMDCTLFSRTFGITLPSLKNEIQTLKEESA
jgi:dTDP-4-dehydrorhamnose reductase